MAFVSAVREESSHPTCLGHQAASSASLCIELYDLHVIREASPVCRVDCGNVRQDELPSNFERT